MYANVIINLERSRSFNRNIWWFFTDFTCICL